ncbi:hypothetical protein ALP82_200061 [Pseudomonas savastanoi pv. fraxini]|nr:hypothetical protein ALO49_200233 [Pseudomonas savastanoi pv. retacarpa]RMR69886.1 hypothetical protein ALP80_200109 [Pseudomonas savastanoi pv. fraxini]RMR69910.1 hypothetical protein ALP82_200061 [Pseudomonas savastanoi pv. fraxini]
MLRLRQRGHVMIERLVQDQHGHGAIIPHNVVERITALALRRAQLRRDSLQMSKPLNSYRPDKQSEAHRGVSSAFEQSAVS